MGVPAINLLVSLKNVALERVVGDLSSDVTEDLEVLGVVRHIEDPAREETDSALVLFFYQYTYCRVQLFYKDYGPRVGRGYERIMGKQRKGVS